MRPIPSAAPGGVLVATSRGRVRRVLFWSVAISVLALGGYLLAVNLGAYLTAGTLLAVLAASVGVGIVVPALLWVDRLEGEPPALLLLMFGWGAIVATAGAIVLNGLGISMFMDFGISAEAAYTVAGPVVVAPLVEEVLKALGLVLLLLTQRRHIHGVVDGIVYAGMVGAGFAFTENILYLGTALADAEGAPFLSTFVIRCLMSPFAHPMFTICVGLAIGAAVGRKPAERGVLLGIGLVVAIALHVFWNASAVLASGNFFGLYVAVQVPVFAGFVVMAVVARGRQSRLIRTHLASYVRAGWLTDAEVAMVASTRRRSAARAHATRLHGRDAGRAMEAFQDEAADLALARVHLDRGDGGWWPAHERHLLTAMTAHRRVAVGG